MKNAPKYLWVIALGLILVSCTPQQRAPGKPSDYFFWHPAKNAVGWILALPGSDGLRVLDDDHHYFDVADRLNQLGWSVLLVDYKPAYSASDNPPGGNTGQKIAWVTQQAFDWLSKEQPEVSSQPGVLMAWSLGAEGAIQTVNNPATVAGLRGAIFYYPSNQNNVQLKNQVPVLILSGKLDNVTPAADVEAMAQSAQGTASVELHLYPDAHHGFDVASLKEPRTIELFPIFGPKYILQYNEVAAKDAFLQVSKFLSNVAH